MDPVLELFARPDTGAVVTYAEVVTASPLAVRFPGTSAADAVEGVRPLSTYTPAVGDTALLVKAGPTFVALGAI